MLGFQLGFGDDGIDHLDDEPLLGLGKLGDAVEVLGEVRRRATSSGAIGRGLSDQHLVERQIEQIGETGKERRTDTDAPDLVMGEGLLRNAKGIGECLLGTLSEQLHRWLSLLV